jgi:signal transduction histidine kinase
VAETRAIDEAQARVSDYLAVEEREGAAELERAAYETLETLVNMNVAESRAARRNAARWDHLADVVGGVTGATLLITAGLSLWWLRTRAFQPVLALGAVMERFGRGEREARAQESGPAEVREMAERFNQLAADLVAQRDAQMAFLAGVAHDLRNPVSALTISVALVPADKPLPPEPSIRRTIGVVRRQLGRLERMINDLLDATSIEAGQLQIRLLEHDVRHVAQAVMDLFAPNRDHLVTLAVTRAPLLVRCDPMRLEQVVGNLVGNAIKYSPPRSTVQIDVRREGDDAVIAITDSGIGITDTDRRWLFEPFRRVASFQHGVPGAGLGLFVARRIVEAHGGWIDVDTAPGKGSCFSVHLPLAMDLLEATKGDAAPDAARIH